MNSRAVIKHKGKKQAGFTFIELIVVIVLLGLMFSFALPKMDGFLLSGGQDNASRWIVLNVSDLKSKSVKDQVTYSLNVDTSENLFFISAEGMDEEMLNEARKSSFKLSPDLNIVDVIFPYESPDDEEITNILFYKKGYSDNSIIHIENDSGEKISFIIEPFLPGVEIKDGFVLFDE